jgi:hypothetical protein
MKSWALKQLIWISSVCSRVAGEIHYIYRRLVGTVATPEEYKKLLQQVQHMPPQEFNGFIRSYFQYEADGIDFSKHPLVFLKDRAGDCDDYAHLCARLLEDMGYQTYIISVFSDLKRGHAVCVGVTPKGKVFGFGNWPLMEFNSPYWVDCGRDICRIGYNSKPQFIIKFDNRWRLLKIHIEEG